jgi:hypothetical protein
MTLREFVRKISPLPEEGACGETESSHLSSWAVAQLSESPMLLPDLKFHDLVFGHELGSGAFSTVKYARRIIKTLTRSLWPEYAVKVRCNLVVPFPLEQKLMITLIMPVVVFIIVFRLSALARSRS